MLHTADFALVWPKDLFLDEAQALLHDRTKGRWIDSADLLLEEAFAGPAPRDALRTDSLPGAWGPGPRGVVQALVEQADQLRQAKEPRPYWSQRRGAQVPQLGIESVMNEFVRLVGNLVQRGYLEHAFPGGCVDARDFYPPDPSGQLESHLGVADLWPLGASRPRWNQDVFFDLVEVLHDLVARPRSRSFHDYGGCGWHYSDFALDPGRRLYRWKVNQLLGRSTVAFRLAEEGEDVGRLVAVTDDARAELASTMAERNDPTGERVRHGLALFRARGRASTTSARPSSPSPASWRSVGSCSRTGCTARTRARCSRSPTASPSATSAPTSWPTTTVPFLTGCSGGTWPPSN